MNKKYFLIVILFLFILTIVVGLCLGFKQRGYEQTIASPSPVVNVVNPSVEPANNVTGTIDYDPSNIQQLPSKQIGLYPINKTLNGSKTQVIEVAKKMGFSGDVKTENSSDHTLYQWNQDKKYLYIQTPPLIVSFSQPGAQQAAQKITKQMVDTFDKTARSFIDNLSSLPDFAVVSEPTINYSVSLIGSEPLSAVEDSASSVSLAYNLLIENIPMLSSTSYQNSFNFTFDSSGNIITFHGNFYPGLNQAAVFVNTFSGNDLANLIATGKGVMLRAESENSTNYLPSFDQFDSLHVVLQGAKLGYYFDPNQEFLVPIYLLRGSSVDPSTNKKVVTSSLIKASP